MNNLKTLKTLAAKWTKRSKQLSNMTPETAAEWEIEATEDWSQAQHLLARDGSDGDPKRHGRPHSGIVQAAWQQIREEIQLKQETAKGWEASYMKARQGL